MTKAVKQAIERRVRSGFFGREFQDYYARLVCRDCSVTVEEAHRDVAAQRHLVQRVVLNMGCWVG